MSERMATTWRTVGIDYCTVHHGTRNEDEEWCDWREHDGNECETCDGTGATEDDDPGGGTFDCSDCDGHGSTSCDLTPLGYLAGDNGSKQSQP